MSQRSSAVRFVSLTALAAVMLAPLPAYASNARDSQRAIGELQNRLGDPETQHAMGDALAGLMAAMMDMKAAPFLKAMDRMGKSMGDSAPRRDIPENATLGDLAGPEARDMPRQIAQRTPAMMGAMGAMAGAMGEMIPQLETVGKRMGEQMRKTMEKSPARDRRGD